MAILNNVSKDYQAGVNSRHVGLLSNSIPIQQLPDHIIIFIVSTVFDIPTYRNLAKIKFFRQYLSQCIGVITESYRGNYPVIPCFKGSYLSYTLNEQTLRESDVSTFLISFRSDMKPDKAFVDFLKLLVDQKKSFCLELVGDDIEETFPPGKVSTAIFKLIEPEPIHEIENSMLKEWHLYFKGFHTHRIRDLNLLPDFERNCLPMHYFMDTISDNGVEIYPGNATEKLLTCESPSRKLRAPGLERAVDRALSSSYLTIWQADVKSSLWLESRLKIACKNLRSLTLTRSIYHCGPKVTLDGHYFPNLSSLSITANNEGFHLRRCEFPVLTNLEISSGFGVITFEDCSFDILDKLKLRRVTDMRNCYLMNLKTLVISDWKTFTGGDLERFLKSGVLNPFDGL